jgi:signal transduction histidine kinase
MDAIFKILKVRRQPLVVVVALLSAASQLLALALAWTQVRRSGFAFADELAVAILTAAVASAGVFLAPRQMPFRLLQAIRFVAIFVARQILSGASTAIELLVLIPFLADNAIYERPRTGAAFNSGAIVALVLCDALSVPWPWPHLALLVLASIASALCLGFLTRYRENIVEDQRRIESLNLAFDSLTDANRGLQLYAAHAESESASRERGRITRELHDSIGYALTNVIMTMSAARVLLDQEPGRVPELLDNTRRLCEECLQETRRTLYRLRSIPDGRHGSVMALSRLAAAFGQATGIDVELHYGNAPWTLGGEIDEALSRLVQEGLTNAFRHGKATQIRIMLWNEAGELRVRIWDNGQGSALVTDGIGLAGMRERVGALGGRVEPRNVVDGFELAATIPIKGAARG